jgi:hypothetical protein
MIYIIYITTKPLSQQKFSIKAKKMQKHKKRWEKYLFLSRSQDIIV